MRGLRLAAFVGMLGLSAEAQVGDVLRNTLEGRTVVVKIDMPAIALGVDVFPGRVPPIDEAELAKRKAQYGVGIPAGASFTLSKILAGRNQIEVLLGWGGAPLDKELRLPDMGSRFRLVYPQGVPQEALTPGGFVSALSGYLDFSTPARTGLAGSAESHPGVDDAAIASLRPGLSRSEVEALLGPPFETVRRQEGDRIVRVASFRATKGTLQAVFENNRLLRWTLEPR